MLNFCKQQVNSIHVFSRFLSTYKCTDFSVGGGQSLGKFMPNYALVNNDIKNNEV